MDFSKFKTSDWLKVGGGGLMLIAGFLPWGKVDFGFGASTSWSAFGFFFRGTIPWLLIVAVGVIAFLLIQGTLKASQAPWPLIFIGASALSTLLVLIFLLSPSKSGVDIDRGFGVFLGIIAVRRRSRRFGHRLQGVGRRPERPEGHQQDQGRVRPGRQRLRRDSSSPAAPRWLDPAAASPASPGRLRHLTAEQAPRTERARASRPGLFRVWIPFCESFVALSATNDSQNQRVVSRGWRRSPP